jgi:hypothetical protein
MKKKSLRINTGGGELNFLKKSTTFLQSAKNDNSYLSKVNSRLSKMSTKNLGVGVSPSTGKYKYRFTGIIPVKTQELLQHQKDLELRRLRQQFAF